ncbi:MAG TPA: hypothetical protein VKS22_02420 [Candidatus Binataceae bacterium]|nr:hypothetical protein [Candidatus Binataceae bacterium]
MLRKRVCLPIWIAALCLTGLSVHTAAQGNSPLVAIRVQSILASYPPGTAMRQRTPAFHMDKRLTDEGVGQRLRSIFDFTNYRLIRNQQQSTHCGDPVAFTLPGGHILHVQPFEAAGDDLAISVMMFEGPHLIMEMPFRMERGGMLFLVNQRFQGQLYIAAISVDSALLHHRHRAAAAVAPDAPAPPFPALVPSQ